MPKQNGDEQDTSTENKKVPEVKQPEKKEDPPKSDIDLDFSVELATEFSNTINEFTAVAAQMVKTRKVSKINSDKCYDLMSKIKNLLDNTEEMFYNIYIR